MRKRKLWRFVEALFSQALIASVAFIPEGPIGRWPAFLFGIAVGMNLMRLMWILMEESHE